VGGHRHGHHAHADAVPDQDDTRSHPPPTQALTVRRALAGRDRGRAAGGATGGDGRPEHRDHDDDRRGGDRCERRVVGHRVGDQVAAAQQGEEATAADVRHGGPRGRSAHGDHEGLGADQPPGLSGGGADRPEKADLDLALSDGDADGGDDGEQDDQGAPPTDDGADGDQRLAVGC
jgi:hypothetical protein